MNHKGLEDKIVQLTMMKHDLNDRNALPEWKNQVAEQYVSICAELVQTGYGGRAIPYICWYVQNYQKKV